jgi:hypothetical protein
MVMAAALHPYEYVSSPSLLCLTSLQNSETKDDQVDGHSSQENQVLYVTPAHFALRNQSTRSMTTLTFLFH